MPSFFSDVRTPWLLFGATSFLASAVCCFYLLRQLQRQQPRTWVWFDRLLDWWRQNLLPLLAVATFVLLASAIIVIIVGIFFIKPTPPESGAPLAADGQAPIMPVDTPTATSVPTPVIIVIDNGAPAAPAAPTLMPTATLTPTAATQPVVTFVAEATAVEGDACSELSWSVRPVNAENVDTVRLGDDRVDFEGTREVCPRQTPGPYQLIVQLADESTLVYTTTIDVPALTATPTGPYVKLTGMPIALFERPMDGLPPYAILRWGPTDRQLTINAQTTDGRWFRVCCFVLGTGIPTDTLWINDRNVVGNLNAMGGVDAMIALSPAPTPPPFMVEAGPEYSPTNNEYLTIYAKVFRGPAGAQEPQPGYMLMLKYKADGATDFVERPATNVGAVSQAQYHLMNGGVHIYNLKYEYDPGPPPPGKTKADLLGAGIWQLWLTNAERTQLSEVITFTTNPGNTHREIFIAWNQVR